MSRIGSTGPHRRTNRHARQTGPQPRPGPDTTYDRRAPQWLGVHDVTDRNLLDTDMSPVTGRDSATPPRRAARVGPGVGSGPDPREARGGQGAQPDRVGSGPTRNILFYHFKQFTILFPGAIQPVSDILSLSWFSKTSCFSGGRDAFLVEL